MIYNTVINSLKSIQNQFFSYIPTLGSNSKYTQFKRLRDVGVHFYAFNFILYTMVYNTANDRVPLKIWSNILRVLNIKE